MRLFGNDNESIEEKEKRLVHRLSWSRRVSQDDDCYLCVRMGMLGVISSMRMLIDEFSTEFSMTPAGQSLLRQRRRNAGMGADESSVGSAPQGHEDG